MASPVIRVENLGKEYQLGLGQEGYKTLRETIMNAVATPLRRFRHLSGTSRQAERIWALKDVSFEVEPGEVVGVIGRNGAGKSTLLKILTRITEPTTGRAYVRGHVGSLLEVGTGFHPELTGRENVFLNGAVLGMPRATVKRRFDEIVDFSGVEKFLDTPVKRFSSGMRVRLAFAVAAHLEPEILLIDEVLAVGDAKFQKKCLGKMAEVARGGRTVLFVSHNMAAVSELCSRAILLQDGRFVADDKPKTLIPLYMRDKSARCEIDIQELCPERLQREIYLKSVATLNEAGSPTSTYYFGETIFFRYTVGINVRRPFGLAAVVRNIHGQKVHSFVSLNEDVLIRPEQDEIVVDLQFQNCLNNGPYIVSFQVVDPGMRIIDIERDCLEFESDISNLGTIVGNGVVVHRCSWLVSSQNNNDAKNPG